MRDFFTWVRERLAGTVNWCCEDPTDDNDRAFIVVLREICWVIVKQFIWRK